MKRYATWDSWELSRKLKKPYQVKILRITLTRSSSCNHDKAQSVELMFDTLEPGEGPKIAILIPEWTTSPHLLSEKCFWIWDSRVIA